ncbi:MAG: hypothetical protein K2Y37_14120 [Pirellulales bacterium]|nr:hypothetical protein [Pirellulales bacterium]
MRKTLARFGRVKLRWLALGVAALLFSASCALYLRSKHKLDLAISELRRRGEPVWASELPPATPEEAAAGDRFRQLTGPLAEPYRATGFSRFLEARPPTLGYRSSEVASFVGQHCSAIDELVHLAQAGKVRFPPGLTRTYHWRFELPGLERHAELQALLTARVLLAWDDHREVDALQAIQDKITVANSLTNHEYALCQQYRFEAIAGSLDLLELAFARGSQDVAQLASLDKLLRTTYESIALAPYIKTERAAMFTLLENKGASPKNPIRLGSAYQLRRLDQQTVMLRCYGKIAEVIDDSGPEADARFQRVHAQVKRDFDRYGVAVAFGGRFESLRNSCIHTRQRLICARLAIHAGKFREAHGDWPASPSDLLDAQLTSVPVGFRSGNSIKLVGTRGCLIICDELADGKWFAAFALQLPAEAPSIPSDAD